MQIKNIPRSPTSGQEKVNATLPADRFFDEVRKQRLDDRRRSAAVEAPAEHGIVLAAFPVAGPMMAEQPALLSAAQAGSAATHAAATAHQGLAQATVADHAPVGASMTVVPANGHPDMIDDPGAGPACAAEPGFLAWWGGRVVACAPDLPAWLRSRIALVCADTGGYQALEALRLQRCEWNADLFWNAVMHVERVS